MSIFDVNNYSKQYIQDVTAYAENLLKDKNELSKKEVNSIFEELGLKGNNKAQIVLDKIASMDGNSNTFSINELKTVILLLDMDCNKKTANVNGKLEEIDNHSGIVNIDKPADLVRIYKLFDNNVQVSGAPNGKLDEDFGQTNRGNCYILSFLIALSKSESGNEIIDELLEKQNDKQLTKALGHYIYSDAEAYEIDEVSGDRDAAILSNSLRKAFINIGYPQDGGDPRDLFYIFSKGRYPLEATIDKNGKVSSKQNYQHEDFNKQGIYYVDNGNDTKSTAFYNTKLKDVPKHDGFFLKTYDERTLLNLKESNAKFAILCLKDDHIDALGEIGEDYVIIYTTQSSNTPVRISMTEFLETYNKGLLLMRV